MKRIFTTAGIVTAAWIFFSFQLLKPATEGDEKPKGSTIYFPTFQLTIGNYVLSNTLLNEEQTALTYHDTTEITFRKSETEIKFLAKRDTLHLYGEAGESSGNKLMQLIPKNSAEHFKVTCWLEECVSEQYDPNRFIMSERQTTDDYLKAVLLWDKNKVRWNRIVKYREMNDSAGFFRIPEIGDDAYSDIRNNPELQLRDTLVDLSGESANIATVVYKNKASYMGICSDFIRIERYKEEQLIDTKYIFIIDTYID